MSRKKLQLEEKKFGYRLKYVRESIGYTQKSMAQIFDVTERTYLKYENGESFPNIDQIQKLEKFGIDFNWLLTGEGEMRASAPNQVMESPVSYHRIQVDFDPKFCDSIARIRGNLILQGRVIQLIESNIGREVGVSVPDSEKELKPKVTETPP